MFLNKSDWDRIKRKQRDETIDNDREAYWTSLNELSQSWIRSWPDTAQGCVHNNEKQKEAQKAKEKQYVEEYIKAEKLNEIREFINSKTIINKARDLIFEDTCYGRELLSAFLDSKTLEERTAQIEFQRKVKVEEKDTNNKSHDNCIIINDNHDRESQKKKDDAKEIALFNRNMFESKRIQDKIKRENDIKNELKDIENMQSLLAKEAKLKVKTCMDKQDYDNFYKQREEYKKLQKKADEEDDLQIELWRKYTDAKNSRAEDILKQIHTVKKKNSEENYKLVENLQKEKNQRLQEFIQKGIDRLMNNAPKREPSKKKINERDKKYSIDEENRKMARSCRGEEESLAYCSQCILPGCSNKCRSKDIPHVKEQEESRIKIVEKPKRREFEQPWSGTYDAHMRFSRHASDTMRQCVHKNSVKKVITVGQREYLNDQCISRMSVWRVIINFLSNITSVNDLCVRTTL